MIILPTLACTYNPERIRFPVIAMPKIDGVRGVNFNGRLTGRSLKEHRNTFVTERFSAFKLRGLDGELALGNPTDPDLCRRTSSALSTIAGSPDVKWYLFDIMLTTEIRQREPYYKRVQRVDLWVDYLQDTSPELAEHLRVIKYLYIHDWPSLQAYHASNIEAGYEGTVFRDPDSRYKYGRSTVNDQCLMRIKDFVVDEARVLSVKEGRTNNNLPTVDARGLTERSTHSENMEPSGQIGTLICQDLTTGDTISVSPGRMPHADREYYWNAQEQIIGRTVKYQHFPHGRKDSPRMATFQCFRSEEDM